MADTNTRQGKRTPVTLKIKFKSETLEQFIERYAVDVSQGGIFIRTKEPLAVGTQMRFEFQLKDASPLIAGEGTVVWTRENDPSRPAIAPGMGVRFDRLAEGSQTVLERILAEKAKQAPQRPANESTKPPMFTDTPTRVAPAPVQEALLGKSDDTGAGQGGPRRKRPDSFGDQGTPLPRPMPFHSDADEFPEEAFEEATKVRALDELIAQTADQTATSQLAADELAARRPRADSTLADPPRPEDSKPAAKADAKADPKAADTKAAATAAADASAKPSPVVDRDSAPGLPSPPETDRPARADATPTSGEAAKTKLGIEPAKIPLRPGTPSTVPATSPAPPRPVAKDATTKPTGMRAVAAEPKAPEASEKSGAPLVLLLLLLLAAGGAAVWFFVIKPKGDDATTKQVDPGSNATPGSGSAMVTNNGSGSAMTPMNGSDGSGSAMTNNGSAGSAAVVTNGSGDGSAGAMAGSNNGSAGSAATPDIQMVETTITAPGADKATIEVLGTDQTGAAPLKAKLEKGKAYKARVTAPGFVIQEVDIKGGEKATAKLVGKPRVVTVSSDPPGALIFVDGGATGHSTPFDIELTKAQSAKKSVRVQLRKAGFRSIERMLDTSKYTEDADKLVAKLDEKLDKAPIVVPNNNANNGGGNTGGGNKTGSGAGSATPANGSGAGSSENGGTSGSGSTPSGTGTGSATGTGSTGTGAGAGAGSSTPKDTTPKPDAGVKPAGTGSGSSSEPEPDFLKRTP